MIELGCDNGGGHSANSDTVWAEEIRKTLGDTEDGSCVCSADDIDQQGEALLLEVP